MAAVTRRSVASIGVRGLGSRIVVNRHSALTPLFSDESWTHGPMDVCVSRPAQAPTLVTLFQ